MITRIHGVSFAALLFATLVDPSICRASTQSVNPNGPMAVVADGSGEQRLYTLNVAGTQVFWRRATGSDGWHILNNPSGVTFYPVTGLIAASPGAGAGRVFAVSTGTSTTAHLWELNPSTNVWRDMGLPSGGNISTSPAMAAGTNGTSTWVAFRTTDSRIWSCFYIQPTGTCFWEDETCIDGTCHNASSGIAVVAGVETHFFTINSSAVLQRFDWNSVTWSSIVSPTGITLTPAAISGVAPGSELRVVMGGHASGSSVDRLELARSTDGGATWAWYRLQSSVEPVDGYSTPFRSSLSYALRSGGSEQFIAVQNFAGDRMYGCRVPTLPSGGGTVSCLTMSGYSYLSQPRDMRVGRDTLGRPVTASVSASIEYQGFSPGFLTSNIVYAFALDFPPGFLTPVWQNLLAPHDAFTVLPLSSGLAGEFTGDEFTGTVAVTDTFGHVWRSVNDGSSWSGPTNAFSGLAGTFVGDTNLNYDAAGTLYTTTMWDQVMLPTHSMAIASVAAGSPLGAFSTATIIPPASQIVFDRPWLTARRDVPNFLIGTFAANDGLGRIIYCDGSADCATTPAAWCPRSTSATQFVPPSSCRVGGGCPVAVNGTGQVWIALHGDAGCSSRAGLTVVGIRQIVNVTSLGTTCTAPVLAPTPECIYYTATPTSGGQHHVLNVGGQGAWSLRLMGSPDSSDIALVVRDYVDLSGNACDATDVSCRSEQRLLRRDDATGRWCGVTPGAACLLPPFTIPATTVSVSYSANGDQMVPLAWVDHVLPQMAFQDFGQVSAFWMDFRGDPSNDLQYDFRRRWVRYQSGTIGTPIVATTETVAWPTSLPLPATYQPPQANYLDVDQTASAHLHAHSFHVVYAAGTGARTIFTVLSSPQAPPQ